MLKLRDFGAFQVDISAQPTHRTAVVRDTRSDMPVPGHIFDIGGERGGSDGTRDTPAPIICPERRHRFAGAIKMIPFQSKGVGAYNSLPGTLHQPVVEERLLTSSQGASRKKVVPVAWRFGITLLLFGLLGKSISWPTLLTGLLHVRYGMVSLSLVVGASGIVLSAYQWRSLLHGEGIRLDLADLVNLYIVGIAFSHFLPTGMGGDAVKALYVGRESGNSAGSASAIILCRVVGFVGMLLVAVPALFIWHEHFRLELITTFVLLSLLVSGILVSALVSVAWLPRLLRPTWKNRRVFTKIAQVGETVLAALRRPRFIAIALAYGIVFWLLAILNCYAYGNALGIHVPSYFYILVVPLIALVSFLPVSINGFGLRESAYVYAFSTMHVSPAAALLLALLLDAQALLFGVVGGCLYITLLSKTKAARLGRAGLKRVA